MKTYGVGCRTFGMVKSVYDGSEACVRGGRKESEVFWVS